MPLLWRDGKMMRKLYNAFAFFTVCALLLPAAALGAGLGAGPGGPVIGIMADHLEHQWGETNSRTYHWDGTISAGYDRDKLIVNFEGAYDPDAHETAESGVEVFYARAIDTYIDLQLGIRAALDHGPNEQFAVAGFAGDLPYGFEFEVLGALSTDGTVLLEGELETDLLITQKLSLNPTITLDLSGHDDDQLGLARGVTGIGYEVRLLYAVTPEFAPYLGVAGDHALGGTRSKTRTGGGDPDETKATAGIRLSF